MREGSKRCKESRAWKVWHNLCSRVHQNRSRLLIRQCNPISPRAVQGRTWKRNQFKFQIIQVKIREAILWTNKWMVKVILEVPQVDLAHCNRLTPITMYIQAKNTWVLLELAINWIVMQQIRLIICQIYLHSKQECNQKMHKISKELETI